jgi:hypothetical protein
MQAQTLFDIATKPFDWSALVVPGGLFLFGVVLTWTERKKIGKFGIKKIGYVLCCGGIVVGCYIWGSWVARQHDGARALRTGRYSQVEGQVSNFHPMPLEAHPPESFTIGQETFSYSDYVVTPCFNNTSSHGGPIRPGLTLRVSFNDDCILRIDLLGNGDSAVSQGSRKK